MSRVLQGNPDDAQEEDETYWDQRRVMSSHKIKGLIDAGARCNKLTTSTIEQYLGGVSTIGNTLPSDIVYALQAFTSDDPNFRTEPEYEFFIPDAMQELITCPVAEEPMAAEETENMGGGAGLPAQNSGYTAKICNDSSSDDSSSDDE